QFPLLDLPIELIVKIFRLIPSKELSALRVDKRIDYLDSRKDHISDLAITTTSEWSEINCNTGRRYSPSARSSMEGIMERFEHLRPRFGFGNMTLTFDRPNPFHVKLVEEVGLMQPSELKITCSYANSQTHSGISNLITDDFLRSMMAGKSYVMLHAVCRLITAEFLHYAFMSGFRRFGPVLLRVFVPNGTVANLLKCFGIVVSNEMLVATTILADYSDGVLTVYNGDYCMEISLDSGREGATLTGEDNIVVIRYQVENDYHFY
ncbi:hypothetical protein PFISCL1PPCAC_20648, partial [Pristionchus fissidentatus]